MAKEDSDLDPVERELPPASGVAFARARINVLASGLSVLQSQDGAIFEVFPDGRRRFVKAVDPPTVDVIGRKIILK